MRVALFVLPILTLVAGHAWAQDNQDEKLRKEILKEVEDIVKREEAKLLESIARMIEEEFAKIGPKKKEEPKEPKEPARKKRGYLGVRIGEIPEDQRGDYGLEDNDGGILITEVMPDTAAEKAGLEGEDIILKVDGEKVYDVQSLIGAIQGKGAGEKTTFTILRDGKRNDREITLGVHPEDMGGGGEEEQPPEREAPPQREQPSREQMEQMIEQFRKQLEDRGVPEEQIEQFIQRIRQQYKERFGGEEEEPKKEEPKKEEPKKEEPKEQPTGRPYLGVLIEETDDGLLVSGVREGTPAEKAGFQEGDVIVRIAGEEVTGESTLGAFMKGAKPGQKAVFVVVRDGKKVEVEVTLGTR